MKDYGWNVYLYKEQGEDYTQVMGLEGMKGVASGKSQEMAQVESVDVIDDGTLEEEATMVDQMVHQAQLWYHRKEWW